MTTNTEPLGQDHETKVGKWARILGEITDGLLVLALVVAALGGRWSEATAIATALILFKLMDIEREIKRGRS